MFDNLAIYVGPVAGITTAVFFAGTSVLFTEAVRRLGAMTVNAVRLALAITLLAVTHRLATGLWIPPAIGGQLMFLALSGIVGLVIGDQALFIAFVDIGPRLCILIQASCPLVATLFGWVALPGYWNGPPVWPDRSAEASQPTPSGKPHLPPASLGSTVVCRGGRRCSIAPWLGGSSRRRWFAH